ncbi:MAG: DUF1127 domain-containing protein [Alphaproteobacteria bacterium]|nr:DUF1127 domain-containing protein [Alphaproteobacteria bacterium]
MSNLFASARKALSDWRQRQRAYSELTALDDRALADIGIHRSEIPAIVEGVHGAVRPAASTVNGRGVLAARRQTA